MEPTGGAGSLPPCGRRRRCRGARRGQRAAAPGAACSGTNCPILRQGPGPGPSPRINSRPAGPKLPGRAAAAVLPAPRARAVRPVLRPGDAAHCGRYPGKKLELAGRVRGSAVPRLPPGARRNSSVSERPEAAGATLSSAAKQFGAGFLFGVCGGAESVFGVFAPTA